MSSSKWGLPHIRGVVLSLLISAIIPAAGCGNGVGSRAAPADRDTLPNTIVDEPLGPGNPAEDDDAVAPPLNHPPSAVARAVETTEGGSFVDLDGSESYDADGDALTFRWAQTGGADLELRDPNMAIAGFVAPPVEEEASFEFTLTVSDGAAQAQAVVTVVVAPAPKAAGLTLTADAGPDQSVLTGDAVTLTGTGDGAREEEVVFAWTQTAGPSVGLDDSSSAEVLFPAPDVESATDLEFELIVSAGHSSASDTVVVTVYPVVEAPPSDDDPPADDDSPTDDDPSVREAYEDSNVKAIEFLYRRADIKDVVAAHLCAFDRAPAIGFGRFIISAATPFRPDDVADRNTDAPCAVRDRVPAYEAEFARRGWGMVPRIDRAYDSSRARNELRWAQRYDFAHRLSRLQADEDPCSPLTRAVGAKGYHPHPFAGEPYPVERHD